MAPKNCLFQVIFLIIDNKLLPFVHDRLLLQSINNVFVWYDINVLLCWECEEVGSSWLALHERYFDTIGTTMNFQHLPKEMRHGSFASILDNYPLGWLV